MNLLNKSATNDDDSLRLRQLMILSIVGLFTFLSRHLQLDDGLIYDRYIDNALHGIGLVYNAGEPVNGLTSPLYDYLLLAFAWLLKGQVQLAALLIFCISFSGTCLLAERLYRYSGVVLSTMAYFYWLIGMDTALFLFLLMLSVFLYVKDRSEFLPAILTLAILTRLEAGALAVVIVWNLWREKRMPKLLSLLPCAVMILAYLFLNLHLYGHILSDSSKAKFGQGMSGYWGVWPTAFLRIWHVWPYFTYTPYFLIGIALYCRNGIKRTASTSWNDAVIPFLAILFLFYWLFNLPAYHWYYAPFILFFTIYSVIGISYARIWRWLPPALLALQIGTNAWWLAWSTSGQHEYARVGKWLYATTAPDARVAAVEIGEIGWVSHRYIIDILGLTTPKNAIYIAHRDTETWLKEDKPDYIVVHKPLWIWERSISYSSDYEDTSFHSNTISILHRRNHPSITEDLEHTEKTVRR